METGKNRPAINPEGHVPALGLEDGGDGGGMPMEDLVILNFIADHSGKLMPADGIRCRR